MLALALATTTARHSALQGAAYPACSSDSDCFDHPLYRCVGCRCVCACAMRAFAHSRVYLSAERTQTTAPACIGSHNVPPWLACACRRYNASLPAGVCYGAGGANAKATCQCMAEAPGDQCGPTNFKKKTGSALPSYLMVSISAHLISWPARQHQHVSMSCVMSACQHILFHDQHLTHGHAVSYNMARSRAQAAVFWYARRVPRVAMALPCHWATSLPTEDPPSLSYTHTLHGMNPLCRCLHARGMPYLPYHTMPCT